MTVPDSAQHINDLGIDILKECRRRLMVQFRFLNRALWLMPLKLSGTPQSLATDGTAVYLYPLKVILRYRLSPDEALRDFLHLLLHCVFRHPFAEYRTDVAAWSLACDITVEQLAMELCGARNPSAQDARRKQALDQLLERYGTLNTVKLYRALRAQLSDDELDELGALFHRDDHSRWACVPKPTADDDEQSQVTAEHPDDGAAEPDPADDNQDQETPPGADDNDAQDEEQQNPPAASHGNDGQRQTAQLRELESAEDAWEDLAVQIELELRGTLHTWGDAAGTMLDTLAVANRKTCDYRTFLQQFAALTEVMKVNDEEFDYLFYTYGLSRYGNMPLIEPLEYQETKRVTEFALVIDTSGSCSADLVHRFLRCTYGILQERESFTRRINVHIIQADAAVQNDTKITCPEELEAYFQRVTIAGRGGTDFRPAFQYVNDLREQGEFENLRGLIYFTDGEGTYPDAPPPFDAAFVFMNDELSTPHVPPWAMKVLLDEETVQAFE